MARSSESAPLWGTTESYDLLNEVSVQLFSTKILKHEPRIDLLEVNPGGDLGDVLGKWLPGGGPSGEGAVIIPPKQKQAFNQGGMFVFADGASRFVHYDASTGAHADVDAVVDLALSL